MRIGICGFLAYWCTALHLVQAQTGGYEEPLPVQAPATRYGLPYAGIPSRAPTFARFPNYTGPAYPAYPSAPSVLTPLPGMPLPGMPWAQMPLPETPLAGMPSGYGPLPANVERVLGETGSSQPISSQGVGSSDGDGHTQVLSDEGLSPPDLPLSDMPPPEPAEPYMVGPVGTWKPGKGYWFYGSADYLFWWVKGQPLSASLSLSLSNPNTVPELTAHGLDGGHFFLGAWLSERQDLGIEAGYFFLGARTATETQNFPGSAVTNKPIFDGIAAETSQLTSSTTLWGSEANVRYGWWRANLGGPAAGGSNRSGATAYLDLLGGFRYVDLSENLTLNNSTLFGTAPVLLSNALLNTSDSFGTHNHLFAGQIGADAGVRWGPWSLELFSKVALGDNRQTVVIGGNTAVSAPLLGSITAPGGFFAQPSNIGRFSRDQFSVLPEAGLNVAFKLGDHCRLGVGYTFLYFANVVRPGQQIDPMAGGATRPAVFFLGGPRPNPLLNNFAESGFWAQGLSATLEISF